MPSLSTRGVRQRCERLIESLEIRPPFELDEFIIALARRRGKQIVLAPRNTIGEAPCGLWLCYPRTDYIVYEVTASPAHRQAIVLHEVGHMVCDHGPAWAENSDLLDTLAPDIDPVERVKIMARSGYSSPEERQAETFASLALARVSSITVGDSSADPRVRRLEAAFSRRPRSGRRDG
jgi:hypothetical protein